MPEHKPQPAYLVEDDNPSSVGRGAGAAFWALTLGFWGFNLLVSVASNRLDGLEDWAVRAEARLLTVAVGICICFLIHVALERCRHWMFWKRATLLIMLAGAGGDGLAWASYWGLYFAGNTVGPPALPGTILINVIYWAWFLLAWGSLYLAFSYSREVREKERRWAAIQALAQAAQMRALQYQIRPHFLFNALNAAASLVLDARGAEAVTMIRRLSDFLRRSLDLDPVADISLGDEIELQRLYLEVETARFPDLEVEIDIDPQVRDALVPALILQPVVENSVKYALGQTLPRPTISIQAHALAGDVMIIVEDSGGPPASGATGTGIGLQNVQQRLAARYGNRHSFEAGTRDPSGFRVAILIPRDRAT